VTVLPGMLQTFWHSSAHIFGEALESCFGAKLTIGPALEEGFYYDCYLGDRTLTEADRPKLEKRIQEVTPTSVPFCVCASKPHLRPNVTARDS
jgi:threonyl-tRNA synthetase